MSLRDRVVRFSSATILVAIALLVILVVRPDLTLSLAA